MNTIENIPVCPEILEANKRLQDATDRVSDNRNKTRLAESDLAAINQTRKDKQLAYEATMIRSELGEETPEAVESAYQALLKARGDVDRAHDRLTGLKGAHKTLLQRQDAAHSHREQVYRSMRRTSFEQQRLSIREKLLPLLEDYGVVCTVCRERPFSFEQEMWDLQRTSGNSFYQDVNHRANKAMSDLKRGAWTE